MKRCKNEPSIVLTVFWGLCSCWSLDMNVAFSETKPVKMSKADMSSATKAAEKVIPMKDNYAEEFLENAKWDPLPAHSFVIDADCKLAAVKAVVGTAFRTAFVSNCGNTSWTFISSYDETYIEAVSFSDVNNDAKSDALVVLSDGKTAAAGREGGFSGTVLFRTSKGFEERQNISTKLGSIKNIADLRKKATALALKN